MEEERCGGSTSYGEVLLGCTETNAIETETDMVLFKIDLQKLGLQKLDEILVPSNAPNDSKNNMLIPIWKKSKKIVWLVKKV